ncbi:L-alanine-DL-glutamate epimerase-like enolase superfamily enzyme [Tamaricihabitans halophyticus]|uniref:L-alanine-DL-glutamate epimerase-like enolase superfamily enzyme n=1 Tax=Tamaricihabitans halophyticus TaxID=1262583 RepID=A0A4R2QFM9_9PSEU|nr:mandelate racemase/muconate lactonizing enzyme family protein [Tamaricihabitans halophyticus]TCP47952.1 L-alanine-DL-glutamate epimerase-like enolase superfamily enzyme [Tamaricihabitans halophyticus]
MKITDITIEPLRTPLDPPFYAAWDPVPRAHFDATLVRVHTDEGITGVGSGDTMAGFDQFAQYFLGTDPLRIEEAVRVIESLGFHAGRYWPLEAALWDILGKTAGLPVSALLGNLTDRIPVYASWGATREPAQRADDAHALVEQRFRAVKIRIRPAALAEGIAAVRTVREAVGDRLDIMVDLNQAWRMAGDPTRSMDLARVRSVVRELSELDVFWVEEPLPYDDIAGYQRLRADNPGPRIAAGEMLDSFGHTLGLLEADALDVYQTDVVLALGISRARTIAELARAKHRGFTPHTWTNGLGVLANLHLTAGVGGGPYLEFPYDPAGGWTPERRDFFLAEPLWPDEHGCLQVPSAPGLGAELDEAEVRRCRR